VIKLENKKIFVKTMQKTIKMKFYKKEQVGKVGLPSSSY